MTARSGSTARRRQVRQLDRARQLNLQLRFEDARELLSGLGELNLSAAVLAEYERLREAVELNRQSYEYEALKPRLRPRGWKARLKAMLHARRARRYRSTAVGTWFVKYHKRDQLKLVGHVTNDAEFVLVFANDVLIKSVAAQKTAVQEVSCRKFSFILQRGLLASLDPATSIHVSAPSGPLLHVSKKRTLETGYAATVPYAKSDVRERLSEGWLLTKKGTFVLRRDRNPNWQQRVLEHYRSLNEYFRATFGYELWMIYGSLLGYSRAGDFIPHDDDFDVAFLSRYSEPEDVRKELKEIAERMIADGHAVKISPNGVLAPITPDGRKLMDIYSAWLYDGRLFAQSTTAVHMSRSDIEPLKPATFKDHDVLLPARPDVFLSGKYGPRWRSPDPSYRKQMAPDAGEILARARPDKTVREAIDTLCEQTLGTRRR